MKNKNRKIGLLVSLFIIICIGSALAQGTSTVMVDSKTRKLVWPLDFFSVNNVGTGGGTGGNASGTRVFVLPVPFGYAVSDFVIKAVNPTTGDVYREYTSNPLLGDPCITAQNGVPFVPDKVEVWSGVFTPSGIPWVKPSNQSIAQMTGGKGAVSIRATVSEPVPDGSIWVCAFATASGWIKHNGKTAVWTLE